ncbi:2761_t:CDS:1 [Acaulospora morrowiae]|uniref:2761_t:CDS:1 n=1 Tax=Acaulospora morrowiae TaxID=94023 RepID=A0A9N8V9K8_9GLOM|nr:2761_t:CDS:1 [Acaulospora morrowiae]
MNSVNSEFSPFGDITIPDPLFAKDDVQNAVANFRNVSEYETSDSYLREQIYNIRDEGKAFRKITIESATTSDEIADYCDSIKTTIESLVDGDLTGVDFSDVLKDLLSTATRCKGKAVYFKNEYTRINSNLDVIYYGLQKYVEKIEVSKNELEGELRNEKDKKDKAEKKRNKNIAGALLGVAAAFPTSGLSLVVTVRSTYKVAKNQSRISECRENIELTNE